MSEKSHIHKYYRVPIGRGEVMACALSDCRHHMPEHYINLLLGKKTICWECEKPFYMDEEAMVMRKPICAICRNSEAIKEISEQLSKSDV